MTLTDVLLTTPLVVLVVLARIHRTYRKRKVRLRFMTVVAVLGVFPTARLVLAVIRNPAHLSGIVAGVLFGLGLSLLGVYRGKYEYDSEGVWHKPDPYAGTVFLALILGWLAYRLLHWDSFMQNGIVSLPVPPPWGLFIPSTVVGYWYMNYADRLRHVVHKKRFGAQTSAAPCSPKASGNSK
jgi:hypothetical protein